MNKLTPADARKAAEAAEAIANCPNVALACKPVPVSTTTAQTLMRTVKTSRFVSIG